MASDMPWSKFFWSDWDSDEGLKQCSLAAQGLWMRMLCICAKSDPRGYLTIAGNPLDVEGVSTAVGRPQTEVETLMGELARWGVFSRDRSGRIYSRRMLRESKLSQEGRKHVKKRWQQTAENKDENPQPNRAPNSPPTRGPKTQKPEARSQKERITTTESRDSAHDGDPGGGGEGQSQGGDQTHDQAMAEEVQNILGVDASTDQRWWNASMAMTRLRLAGATDDEIRAAANDAKRSTTGQKLPGPGYVEKIATRLVTQRKTTIAAAAATPAGPQGLVLERPFARLLRMSKAHRPEIERRANLGDEQALDRWAKAEIAKIEAQGDPS
ncbi:hypothetical protein [Thalassobaculum sp.]|uniref:hypothetical protein n=1 Tax=Thalassobaculum sp. TaxID=2022740 RepID=UPI0032EEC99A